MFRRRRLLLAIFVLAVMGASVAAMRQKETPTHSFRVVFGLNEQKPTDWSGKVDVQGGEVASLEGWRFEDTDAVQGLAAWKCETRNQIAPGKRYPLQGPDGKPKGAPELQPWANGIHLTVRGANPSV